MRRAAWLVPAFALAASAASAQAGVEIGGSAGYTFSDGVTFPSTPVPGQGEVVNEIQPVDAFSWGLNLGAFVNDNVSLEFLWSRQQSSLELSGPGANLDVADINVDNYHGVIAYHFGYDDAKARPFVFGGLGATRYGSFDIRDASRSVDGETRFSTTWGAGLKLYPSERVGMRLQVKWTPTYIKSDPAGYWCDPFWGCFVASNDQFSNQFEFSAGLGFRF